jgi:hypothetical protein
MPDSGLAAPYGADPEVPSQAVKRTIARGPEDFMFQHTAEEAESPGSQSVTLKSGAGQHRKSLPYAFTGQGVAMLTSVLRSPGAVQMRRAAAPASSCRGGPAVGSRGFPP